ncbi:MAG: DegV family protein [Firmicutes bacterium]|nr:DegV family protein [Bacillota bacterium]
MKREIAIVTDSAASLPQDLVDKYDITVVPFPIQFGSEAYKDGVDITREEFYRKLNGSILPSTSQPSPSDFINIYEGLLKKFKTIISIHITSEGSGTCQVANIAKDRFPGADIEVFDSKSASMGIGFLVLEAAEAILRGKTKDDILCLLTELRPEIITYAVIDSIRYLLKSGRVRTGEALMASLLSIKPLISIRQGVVEVVDRVRTYRTALDRLVELAVTAIGAQPEFRLAVVHGNAIDEANKLCARLKSLIGYEEIIVSDIGPALAIHGGPGILGIVCLPIKRR